MSRALDWRLLAVGGLIVVLAGAVLIFRFDPRTAAFFPRCPLHAVTGLHCPGCGSTRALHSLLHGDLLGALKMNAFLVFSLPLLGALVVAEACRVDTSRCIPAWMPRTFFALVFLYTIARNLPWPPFSLLAPH